MAQIEVRDKLSNKLLEQHEIANGESLQHWINVNIPNYDKALPTRFSIAKKNRLILQKQWASTVAKNDSVFVLCPEPGDPGTIGLFILKTIATIAINYAISALLAPSDNYNRTVPEGSSIYDVNAQGNRPRLNGVIPELFGTHPMYPDNLNQPSAIYVDNVLKKRFMLSCGVGEYDILESNISNTPIDRYGTDIASEVFAPGADVSGNVAHRNIYTSPEVGGTSVNVGFELGLTAEIDPAGTTMPTTVVYSQTEGVSEFRAYLAADGTDYDWPYAVDDYIRVSSSWDFISGDYKVSAVSTNILTVVNLDGSSVTDFRGHNLTALTIEQLEDPSGGIDEYHGPFLACPKNETTETIMVNLFYPEGVGKLTPDGTMENVSVVTELDWREVGTTTWTTVEYTKTDNTRDQQGDTHTITLPSAITPEVRMRKTSAESSDTSTFDKVLWQTLMSILPTVTSYADITTMAVEITGTNALANSAQNTFNTLQQRKLPIWNGTSWTAPTATNAIAPVFAYIPKDCGYTDDQLALDEMYALHTLWETRGDEFSAVFDTDSTLYESLKRVLAVGYAELIQDNGKLKPVRDGIRTDYGQFFSIDNTTSIKESGNHYDPDEADGVEVEYFDVDTKKTEKITYLLSGDAGINPEQVRAFGITDATRAWRFGARVRRAKAFQRKSYAIDTEMEGLNALPGDLCSIPGRKTQMGWLEAVAGTVYTLQSKVTFTAGVDNWIGLRKPDGSLSGPYLCTQIDDYNVNIAAALDFTPDVDGPADPPLFKLGTLAEWHTPVIVRKVSPGTPDETGSIPVGVDAVIYDERVFAEDDNAPA
jgi:hypothetical protein